MGQSSNNVIPSAIRISVAEELKNRLVPPLGKLHEALEAFLAPAIDSPKYPDQQLDQEAT
jgi:fumarate hydratase class II